MAFSSISAKVQPTVHLSAHNALWELSANFLLLLKVVGGGGARLEDKAALLPVRLRLAGYMLISKPRRARRPRQVGTGQDVSVEMFQNKRQAYETKDKQLTALPQRGGALLEGEGSL